MKSTISLSLAIIAVFSSISLAHHGSNGQFDTSKNMQVSGTITDIKFVNPHSYVYFDVSNDEGSVDNWRCELRAGSLLKRNGWTTDMFASGTKITIDGSPARREEFGCFTKAITYEDGRVLTRFDVLNGDSNAAPIATVTKLANGIPSFAGNWAAPQRVPGAAGGMGAPTMGAPAMAPGGMGRGGASLYTKTDAGKAATEDFVSEDNPRFHCQAVNIFHDWWFDQHVNTIEQTDNTIKITYGFMDIVRTIHLNMESHPNDIIPSRAGHSIGKWDGDTLIVDTIGFAEGYLDPRNGVKHSDALHTVEKFSLSEDGKTLSISYTGDDEKFLVGTFSGSRDVLRTNAAFDPYECEDLTEEIVEGF